MMDPGTVDGRCFRFPFKRTLNSREKRSPEIMETDDERIPEDLYSEFLSRLPQVSVELFLENDGEVLLCRRNNRPQKGEWFWPGSRLRKGEELREAARRVAEEELGIEIEIKDFLGVYSHFWEESAFEGVDTLHTVNVVFHVVPEGDPEDITLDGQHGDFEFFSEIRPEFHEHVKKYMQDSGLFG